MPIACLQSSVDYFPFGSTLPERSYNADRYRFGFNGKENDKEVYGDGNFQDYGMRMYDPRVGRFISADPISYYYPWYSPFQFAGNIVIASIDIDGCEPLTVVSAKGFLTRPVIVLFNALLGYKTSHLINAFIERDYSKIDYTKNVRFAETYSAGYVKTFSQVYQSFYNQANAWLGTLAHEFKHVEQFNNSSFPWFIQQATMNKASNTTEKYFSKNNPYEEPARDAEKTMKDFCDKYNPSEELNNNNLTEIQKEAKLLIKVNLYFIDKNNELITTLKENISTTKSEVLKEYYTNEIKKVENDNSERNSYIEKLKPLTK